MGNNNNNNARTKPAFRTKIQHMFASLSLGSARKGVTMASMDPTNSPQHYSFNINRLFRSISTKESSSPQIPPSSPPRHSSSSITLPFKAIAPPSPLPSSTTPNPDKYQNIDKLQSSHRCISSVLKKDGRILSIALSNGLVYTGSEINCIRVWKLPEFTECGKLKSKASMVYALAASHDRIFAAYSDCKIRVWRRTWEGSPTHVRLATIPKLGNYVRNYIAGKDKKMMKHLGPISSLAINVSDDLLYSASTDKTVKVWRMSDLKCIETIQAHSEPVNAVEVGEDGVLYTASDDATVRVWRRTYCNGDRPHSLTITLPAKQSPVKALTLSTDSGFLYGGCTDGYIHYWLKIWFSGQLQYGGGLQGHTHAIMCLTSVTNYVVSGSADLTCRVWVRERDSQHSCVAVLQGHRGPVRCVSAFTEKVMGESEEGCTVCTGSLDGIRKVWRVSHSSDSSRNSPQDGKEYFEL